MEKELQELWKEYKRAIKEKHGQPYKNLDPYYSFSDFMDWIEEGKPTTPNHFNTK